MLSTICAVQNTGHDELCTHSLLKYMISGSSMARLLDAKTLSTHDGKQHGIHTMFTESSSCQDRLPSLIPNFVIFISGMTSL